MKWGYEIEHDKVTTKWREERKKTQTHQEKIRRIRRRKKFISQLKATTTTHKPLKQLQ